MPRRQSKFLFACARLTRETTNRNPKTDSTLRFPPLVHHSDRGVQYVSIRYTERLAEAGIEPSIGSVGDSYDCESIGAVRWA